MTDIKDEMSSMVTVLNELTEAGYVTQFKASEKGLCSMSTQKVYKPKQVEIAHFYRFEGDSDPGDNAIIYAIETKDGEKGTLIDSFGPEGDRHVDCFIKEVQAIQK